MLTTTEGKMLTVLEHKNEYVLALTPANYDITKLAEEIHWQSQFGNHVFVFDDYSTERKIIFIVLADEDPTKQLQILTDKLKFGEYHGYEINDPENHDVLTEFGISPRQTVFDRSLSDMDVWPNLGKRPDKTIYPKTALNFHWTRFNTAIHSIAQ